MRSLFYPCVLAALLLTLLFADPGWGASEPKYNHEDTSLYSDKDDALRPVLTCPTESTADIAGVLSGDKSITCVAPDFPLNVVCMDIVSAYSPPGAVMKPLHTSHTFDYNRYTRDLGKYIVFDSPPGFNKTNRDYLTTIATGRASNYNA